MKFRKANPFALSFMSIAVACWIVSVVFLFTGHDSRTMRIAFATATLIFQCAACAAQFGKDIWDPRLIPWSAKNRP
ncbi:MAG: hypothetical protein IAI48_16975 [Candidatus Eremiobacteraeota bacterium]|nr:hypothetical protein [Candidatus Eremiobacteraeota bacterium]